jgi:predicted RNase H-like nuclease (RuvC/YqgF family)
MNLENLNPEGSKSEAQLAKEQARLEETLEGLKQERSFLEKEIAKEKHRFEQGSVGADFTGEAERDRQNQRKKQEEQQRQERIEQEGLKIGTFNINSLDPKIKYGVGFGLLALCGLVIYWFMKELSKNRGRDSPRKSK